MKGGGGSSNDKRYMGDRGAQRITNPVWTAGKYRISIVGDGAIEEMSGKQ